ncbi:gamma-aminobutyric acid receptor subunit pi [Pteropus vampyrus]|uniref:Gamma-aminobutyric acid receptor subunit pi n=1 Tax=Pteropus vampyrus TaxID=132908 RepID=A0A6P3QRP2_PTEVA|nr:gamma-aminobutyric acid receptor subunit pi [Pteropus vampyrus]
MPGDSCFGLCLHKRLLNMRYSLHLTFMCLSLFTGRMCIQGNRFNAEVSRSDKLSLPGFENLTVGYNKFLRPNFGGEPVQIALTLDIASISSISESNMRLRVQCPKASATCSHGLPLWPLVQIPEAKNSSHPTVHRVADWLEQERRSLALHEAAHRGDSTRPVQGVCGDCANRMLLREKARNQTFMGLTFNPKITTTIACNMDLSKYPMDTQTCQLQLESWGYDGNDVEFSWLRGNDSVRGLENLRLAQYTIQRYFTLVTRSQQETGNYTRLILQFELRRNVLYFILETYVPSTFLVVLSWVSFWISLDSVPARTCIGVTTVLSMTTLMIGSRTSLPNTNCFIKAIDVYLGICFSFVFGALLEYAVAHYSSLQQMAAKDRGMPKEVEEVNITNIINSSISSFKRKISFATIEISGDNVDYSNLSMKTSDKFKFVFRDKMDRIVDYFTIQNPSNVDRYSKLLFPLIFMLANVFYWAYYMYF